jgi:hypothetical protein
LNKTTLIDWYTLAEASLVSQAVKDASNLATISGKLIASGLETVQFFQDDDRYYNVIVGKCEECVGVMQENVRIKDEGFFGEGIWVCFWHGSIMQGRREDAMPGP